MQAPGTSSKPLKVQWHVKIPKTILEEVSDSLHLGSPARLSRHVVAKAVHVDQSLLSRVKNRRAPSQRILPKRRMRLPFDHDPRFHPLHGKDHRPRRVHQDTVAEASHAVGNCVARDAETGGCLGLSSESHPPSWHLPKVQCFHCRTGKHATTNTHVRPCHEARVWSWHRKNRYARGVVTHPYLAAGR